MILMEPTTTVFTSPANAPRTLAMPVARADTALPKTFPWLAAGGSTSGVRPSSIEDEFTLFADEAQEWAGITLGTALEGWPDEDWSGLQEQ